MSRRYAIDCEMVGGSSGSMLARVSVVDDGGRCVYDSYVRPTGPVADYRTATSGVTREKMMNGRSFQQVQREIIDLISGCVLVGHSVDVDLEALSITHPQRNIRDVATYPPFLRNGQKQSLKDLAWSRLGSRIQSGQHDSVEDARAAMQLYNTVASSW